METYRSRVFVEHNFTPFFRNVLDLFDDFKQFSDIWHSLN